LVIECVVRFPGFGKVAKSNEVQIKRATKGQTGYQKLEFLITADSSGFAKKMVICRPRREPRYVLFVEQSANWPHPSQHTYRFVSCFSK